MKTGTFRLQAPGALLWGALIVLGWAALSSLLGADTAHAAEDDEPSGLTSVISGPVKVVTATVSDVVDAAAQPVAEVTAGAVGEVLAPVAAPVVKGAEKAVDAVMATPVVGSPTKNAVSETRDIATSTVQPVVAVVTNDPVTRVLQPVTDAIAAVPVVGGALDELGVLDLVDRTAGTVDDILDATDPVLTVTVPDVVDGGVAPAPMPIARGALPDAVATSATVSDGAVVRSATEVVTGHRHAASPGREDSVAASSSPRPSTTPPGMTVAPPGTHDPPAAPSAVASPAGASAGSPASAHEADGARDDPGVTREPSTDPSLPPSPASSTDVSPD
ncbi:hypothetical protein [Microbacterium sp.]|uniref:hypothetical protein n=1 Tax=Microbacterium sp. TaxID=51671 RepID=UPI002811FBAA|nr:hypothetical protein [Microbacterium sp.]